MPRVLSKDFPTTSRVSDDCFKKVCVWARTAGQADMIVATSWPALALAV